MRMSLSQPRNHAWHATTARSVVLGLLGVLVLLSLPNSLEESQPWPSSTSLLATAAWSADGRSVCVRLQDAPPSQQGADVSPFPAALSAFDTSAYWMLEVGASGHTRGHRLSYTESSPHQRASCRAGCCRRAVTALRERHPGHVGAALRRGGKRCRPCGGHHDGKPLLAQRPCINTTEMLLTWMLVHTAPAGEQGLGDPPTRRVAPALVW